MCNGKLLTNLELLSTSKLEALTIVFSYHFVVLACDEADNAFCPAPGYVILLIDELVNKNFSKESNPFFTSLILPSVLCASFVTATELDAAPVILLDTPPKSIELPDTNPLYRSSYD